MKKLPTWVEINLDTLVGNLGAIRNSVDKKVSVLLTIKADAYGHGAVHVAQAADGLVDWFGVATLDEALELRNADIRKRILILSPTLEREIPGVVDNDFATTVSSLDFAEAIAGYAAERNTTTEVHVEIDTGMGRTGFYASDAFELVMRIHALKGLRLGGLFTHYPVSDSDPDFTREQLQRFLDLVEKLKQDGVSIPVLHSANSAAVAGLSETHLDMIRPGLLAYGHYQPGAGRAVAVKPVMSWKSRLVQVRDVPKGTSVSYGRTFVTERNTLMGVVPVGYGHGYPFGLSNSGKMIVGGTIVPIMGRVTMDMTMVDLSDVTPLPCVGDEVVLMGIGGDAEISLDDVARWAGTISYEVLCGISKRVPRTYFRRGKIEAFKSLLGVIPNHVSV
jgi:alanine racemase